MNGARRSAIVIEDAPDLQDVLARLLEREGFVVDRAGSGEEGLERVRVRRPDLIVLDVGLPGIDGIETCRRLRTFSDAYVLMLTARGEELDKLIGFSIGADDYMTKPFSRRELAARIQALLRRPRHNHADAVDVREVGSLRIDTLAREVEVAGRVVELTRTEYALLEALSERPRVALSRTQLLDRVWGPGWFGDDHVVDVHMSNLRRKLETGEDRRRHIRTVRGVGYRMNV